jgi:NAD(P)-dependent dehydrogenase (short-subunit alcohol dehydrogenase family)
MLLDGKHAVIYGGGGSIGSAMARGFAAEGATVHLAGRERATLDEVAASIRAAGGSVTTASVDALDGAAVDAHAAALPGLDISVNVIGVGDVQGTPLHEMDLADFEAPIHHAVRTTFLTTRAAARRMIPRGSGVILTFGGDGGRANLRDYHIGGFQVALGALDTMRRQLAAELGRYQIRVVTMLTGGIAESLPPDFEGRDEIVDMLVAPAALKRTATFADVGRVAAFLASDQAASITGTSVNISCGALID